MYKDKNELLNNYTEGYKIEQEPVIDFTDDAGQTHKIWTLTDEHLIGVIKDFFKDKSIYIADGHHRYETALKFYLEKKDSGPDAEKYGHVLMSLVNIYDEGLLAFPTHRILTNSGIDSATLQEKLAARFTIKELPPAESRDELKYVLEKHLTGAAEENLPIGLYTSEQKLFILTLKKLAETEKPYPWLDAVILQKLVLSDIFGLSEAEIKKESGLYYLRDEWEAKQQVDRHQNQAQLLFSK